MIMAASRQRLHLLPLSHARRKALLFQPSSYAAYRSFSASAVSPAAKRPHNFNSGFTSSYDPTQDAGRGPMFTKPTFGVPQFYPRDLKTRVDEYVVGQDRAKKTICSAIFNHYQSLRRRRHDQDQDRRVGEKLQRQKWARERDLLEAHRDPQPVEGQHYHGIKTLCDTYLILMAIVQTSSPANMSPFNRATRP